MKIAALTLLLTALVLLPRFASACAFEQQAMKAAASQEGGVAAAPTGRGTRTASNTSGQAFGQRSAVTSGPTNFSDKTFNVGGDPRDQAPTSTADFFGK